MRAGAWPLAGRARRAMQVAVVGWFEVPAGTSFFWCAGPGEDQDLVLARSGQELNPSTE